MKTIVFIGTQKSGSSREALKAAEELGYYTVLLTNRQTFIEKRNEFPDAHLMQLCDINEIDEIRKSIKLLMMKALDIMAIVSFVDPYCYTAALLSEEFGLNHFTVDAISIMLNKVHSREVLKGTSYIPNFTTVYDKKTLSKNKIASYLPFIMKSPNSTGSKDVLKITSYKEYNRCLNKLFEKYPEEPILIEEFLDGPQYLVETIVYKQQLNIIAVFKQEITFEKRFIITGYNLMVEFDDSFYDGLKKAVEDIINRHGLIYGPCHLEMRLVKDEWKLIEVNPRISGGGMNNLIKAGFGINLVKETIKMLINEEPELKPIYRENAFAQYVVVAESGTLEKVIGRNRALKSEGVKEVYIRPRKGAFLTPPLSMGNRYAYVIATGKTEDEARNNAKSAASQICFKLIYLQKSEAEEIERQTEHINIEPLDKILKKYKETLIEEHKSKNTIQRSVSAVNNYLNWYRFCYEDECVCLQRDDILKYKNYLQVNKKLTTNTINSKLRYIQKFAARCQAPENGEERK